MAENTEPTDDTVEDVPEVEAHSVLDNQSLGKGIDSAGIWTCLSNLSEINAL
ncbi:hypothetical protein ABZZ74_42580 [Streptomyces sp. NPDC006476]|uniref:hypothetical protein n=1 Tax=Streptomyces sp. NPDC006476 TaxID=3157175 RepID=UPI0033A0AC9F